VKVFNRAWRFYAIYYSIKFIIEKKKIFFRNPDAQKTRAGGSAMRFTWSKDQKGIQKI
jgi:hypothetical protein